MQLTAAIEALLVTPPDAPSVIITNDRNVVGAVTAWAAKWEARGWKPRKGKPENLDLVKAVLEAARLRPQVRVVWQSRARDEDRLAAR